jgi:hypothetical protein
MSQFSPDNQPQKQGQAPQNGAQPRALTPQEQAAITHVVAPPGEVKVLPSGPGLAAPTLIPKSAGSGGEAGTTWLSKVQISALWSLNQDRNVWVYIANTGWVKLSAASESGTVALSLLAAYAKQSQEIVTCRREADGMIHEIYV